MEKFVENEFSMICDSLNGIVIDFEPINWRSSILDCIYDSNLESKWRVNKEELIYKLCKLSNLEALELIIEVDKFWNIDDNNYQVLGQITPQAKILEITSEKHEPIIWNSNVSSLHDFYMVALGLNLEYIIYVQDSEGDDKSVWATSETDLLECLFDISDRFYFGCLERLQDILNK